MAPAEWPVGGAQALAQINSRLTMNMGDTEVALCASRWCALHAKGNVSQVVIWKSVFSPKSLAFNKTRTPRQRDPGHLTSFVRRVVIGRGNPAVA